MKIFLTAILCLLIILILILFYLAHTSKTQHSPGLLQSKLKACVQQKNCICSEFPSDGTHYSEAFDASAELDLSRLKKAILNMGGRIQDQKNNYLSFTFSSRIFGFIDDFELRLDTDNKKIHFRSASRVGRNDFGANRKRLNQLKRIINKDT